MSGRRGSGRQRPARRQPATGQRTPPAPPQPLTTPAPGWWRAHRTTLALGGGVIVVVLLLLPVFRTGNHQPASAVAGPAIHFVGAAGCSTTGVQPYGTTAPSVNAAPAIGQAIDEMPHTHVDRPATVTYTHNPPTSGCHYSLGAGTAPLSPGVYTAYVDPQYWVHNLEHGYIVVLYDCPNGCAADVARLTRWYDGHAPDPALPSEKKIIVIPWTTMSTPFAVESWDWFLPLQTADTARIDTFYGNHVDQSPEGNQAP